MNESQAIDMLRGVMLATIEVSGPVVFATLLVGLALGVMQTATQVQEQSISFLGKLLAVSLVFIVLGPHAVTMLVEYMKTQFTGIATVVR